MFEFEDVKVCYGGACAVNHVSFTLAPGEIVGPVSYTHLDVYKRQV